MFKAEDEFLSKLLSLVESNEIQLPDFQRGWVWEDNRIKALLASLTLGYPVGAIMLLESGGDFHFKCKNVEGTNNAGIEPSIMILDGQQRLTSTYQAMRCKNPVDTRNDQKDPLKRFYYLDIQKALNTTTDRVEAIIAVDKDKQIKENFDRDIKLDLSTEELEFKNKMIPFNKLSDPREINEWRNRYQEYYHFDSEIVKEYQRLDDMVIQKLLNYKIPIIRVLKETPKEAVCQVFENVNQGGVPLTVFELLTATFAADDFDLKAHWEAAKKQFDEKPTLKNLDNTSFLIAMTLLVAYRKGGTISCKKKDVLNLKFSEYKENAADLINGFIRMYDFLVDLKIYDNEDIPYGTQLIPLSVICTILENDLYNSAVKDKLKKWYWCGVFGELYGSANETRYALDVPQVLEWIKNNNAELPKTVQDCNFSAMRLIGLQTKNAAAYKGVMALIMQSGAKDWINDTEMSVTNYIADRADIHHIFPQRYCISCNYNKKLWNSVINKTPIFFATNRFIGGDAPSEYIRRIVENKGIEKEKVLNAISTHYINTELLIEDKFDEFIIDRAIKILDLIDDATGKKITDRKSDAVVEFFGKELVAKSEK